MFHLLWLCMFMVLMDEVIRVCNECEHFDGFQCRTGFKSCWKFNMWLYNKSCTSENYYFSDRLSGRYLFRYSVLSCKPCFEGMFQVFHDLLRETFCCSDSNKCNDGRINFDVSPLIKYDSKEEKEVNED